MAYTMSSSSVAIAVSSGAIGHSARTVSITQIRPAFNNRGEPAHDMEARMLCVFHCFCQSCILFNTGSTYMHVLQFPVAEAPFHCILMLRLLLMVFRRS